MAGSGLGTLTLDLVAKIAGFTGPLSAAERDLKKKTDRMNKMAYNMGQSFGQSMRSAAGHVLAFAGVSLTIGAAASSFKQAIDYADGLRDSSIRLGMSTESLSAYSYAAKQTGTDLDTLQRGLKILSKNATEALNPKSAQAGLFASMGISKGALTDLNTLLPQVAEHFSKMADGPQKTALAMELFGKAGADLIELLNQGAGGLQSFADRAKELGIIIDRDAANAADDFNDKLGDLKTAQQGVTTQITAGMLPALRGLVEGMTNAVTKGGDLRDLGAGLGNVMIFAANAVSGMARVVKTLAVTATAAVSDLTDYYNIAKQIQTLGMADGTIKQSAESLKRNHQQYSSTVKGIWDEPWFGSNAQASAADKARDAREKAVEARAAARRAREAANAWVTPPKPTPTGGGSRAGSRLAQAPKITDEHREAEKLKDSYGRLMLSMEERMFMLGKEGEVAKVSWDTQRGDLAKLTQAQKDAAIAAAQGYDLAIAKEKKRQDDEAEQKRAEESARNMLASLTDEIEMLGMSNSEQEIHNNLKRAGVDANSEYGQSIVALTEQAQKMRDMRDLADGAGDAFVDMFESIADGSKSASDAFGDFITDTLKMIARFLMEKAVQQFIASMFGSGFGGGASYYGGGLAKGGVVDQSGLQAFANGGVFTNGIYDKPTFFKYGNGGSFGVMGEAGAEAVMPLKRDSSGRLGVVAQGGGGTNVQISQTFNIEKSGGSSSNGAAEQFTQRMRIEMEATAKRVISEEQRQGGQLWRMQHA